MMVVFLFKLDASKPLFNIIYLIFVALFRSNIKKIVDEG